MALHCNSLLYNPFRIRPLSPFKLFSPTRLSLSYNAPLCVSSSITFKLPRNKLNKFVSAVITEESAVGSSSADTDVFKLTYLEGNSWLWDVGGMNILVDPISMGNLDFGIPWLYDASKKFLKNFQVTYLEPGQSSVIESGDSSLVRVQATAGPVLGPPWQQPEIG